MSSLRTNLISRAVLGHNDSTLGQKIGEAYNQRKKFYATHEQQLRDVAVLAFQNQFCDTRAEYSRAVSAWKNM
jgi:hypothetical protein